MSNENVEKGAAENSKDVLAVGTSDGLCAMFEELEAAWDAYDRLTDTGFDWPRSNVSNARKRMNKAIKELKRSA